MPFASACNVTDHKPYSDWKVNCFFKIKTSLSNGGSITTRFDWSWTDDVEDVPEEMLQIPDWQDGFQDDDNSYGLHGTNLKMK